MTDRFEPTEPDDEHPADAPFLPPSSPSVHPTTPPLDSPALGSPALDDPPPPPGVAPHLPPSPPPVHPTAPPLDSPPLAAPPLDSPPLDSPPLDGPALDAPAPPPSSAPQLPSVEPPAAAPAAEPAVFDAKAMMESQKRSLQHPVYGGIPKATPESAAALEVLRVAAQRKRRRNRTIGWLFALAMLAVVAAAGWFAYREYQDDQDRQAAEQAARRSATADTDVIVPDALTPLGNQEQVIEVLDELNSGGATPSAGGLAGAVDDARAAVDGVAPEQPGSPDALALTLLDVRPEAIVRHGERLDDLDGFERHVVDRRRLADDSPDVYARFVAAMQALPQADPQAVGLDVLAGVGPGQIGVAVVRDGDALVRAVIVSSDPPIHVDYTP